MRLGITFFVPVLLIFALVFAERVVARKNAPIEKQISKAPDIAGAPKSPQTQPAKKAPNLRAPGFLFLELYTRDVTGYIEFFRKVAGFEPVREEPGYALVQSERAEIIFNGGDGPFGGKLTGRGQGVGVEIGIVVADLDKSFAAAEASGWKIGSKIKMRSWGVRDFRVYTPDGYYLRFTEAPK